MRSLIYLFLLILLLTFCRKKEVPDGGPCSYTNTNYPAVILEIYDLNNTLCDLEVIADFNGQLDTLTFNYTNNKQLTKEELKALQLKKGDTITYQHMQITSGSCNPDIFTLLTDRYNKPIEQ